MGLNPLSWFRGKRPEHSLPRAGIAYWYAAKKRDGIWETVTILGRPNRQHAHTFSHFQGPFASELAAMAFASMENKALKRRQGG